MCLEGDAVEVDIGVLTGESVPKLHSAGDIVPSGAVPIDGPLIGIALADARLLFGAWAVAATTGHPVRGAAVMFVFSLVTLPALPR